MKLPHQILGFFLFSIPFFFLSCLDEGAVSVPETNTTLIQCIESPSDNLGLRKISKDEVLDAHVLPYQEVQAEEDSKTRKMRKDLENWAFLQLLAEKTSAEEIAIILRECNINEDFNLVPKQVMSSNNYSKF